MKLKIQSIFFIFLLPLGLYAQEGGYIDVYATAFLSQIKNNFDAYYGPYNGLGIDYKHPQTLSYGTALLFTKTGENYIGWRSGLIYSNYAQSFSSRIEMPDTSFMSYTSRLNIQQLSAPLLVNFGINSGESTDRVYFNMGFGFQLNYLFGAKYNIEPAGNYTPTTEFEFNDYFYRIGLSYLLNIELKIGVGRGDKSHILFGVFFDKSINNIEKTDQNFAQEVPVELKYPLGTLKNFNYDVKSDRLLNYKMKTEALALRVGYSYKLFK